ncbi:beta-galactosidase [Gorillibacterium massiliense]|uniref:beta-galactosidase n=1 Tax=Gorillibacterium massiliense TaxID=1280390 RepID=UPI0004AD4538|nr:beta-galactosidase [Gorillibacterium massiliense]
MSMTYVLQVESFTASPDTRLEQNDCGGLAVTAPPEGGSLLWCPDGSNSQVWSEYAYLTGDIYHECHDVLVLVFSFIESGGRRIDVHYGMLPHVKTRVCIPLKVLEGESLFLPRYPGVLQSVLRGDSSVDRSRISRVSISTPPSVSLRSFKLSGLELRMREPDFCYEYQPYLDELGQLAEKEWVGKTGSHEEMKLRLEQEEAAMQASPLLDDIGRYGGWKGAAFASTGYFRTVFDGSSWWFVDPDGYGLFSTGMDCVGPFDTMKVAGMEHLLPPLPDRIGPVRDAWTPQGFSYSVANLIRVYGDSWRERWEALTEGRLKVWGTNTIANWSDSSFIRSSSLPYVYPMEGFPETKETIFRDFPDVFSPEYEENAKSFASGLLPFQDEPRLVGYFMRNEPHWAFVDSLNLTELLLAHPSPLHSKLQFVRWLEEKYETIIHLNEAWGSSFHRFEELAESNAHAEPESGVRKADYDAFDRVLIRRYVEVPARACKAVDPHHLNLGMRYAWVSSDAILEGCEAFDVFSINCYRFEPDRELIERIGKRLNRPVMIGEFHFGAADSGLPAYGIKAVATQEERGQAYRYYIERAAAIPELIGAHYFQLSDQPALGRFDGENYQIGAVDVCQRPYEPFIEQMKLAHGRIYAIRTGSEPPYEEAPAEIPKTGF